MGRRSRKRPAPPPAERREPPAAAATPRTPPPPTSRRARLDEAPKPPWHPFPLVELCILAGLVLMVVGFVKGGNRGGLFAVCGIALVGVASLELAIREHFAGYRSHSSLLASALGVGTMLILGIGVGVARLAAIGIGAGVFLAAFLALRAAFRRRTGGVAFRA
jgi:uncharacterized membrane protein